MAAITAVAVGREIAKGLELPDVGVYMRTRVVKMGDFACHCGGKLVPTDRIFLRAA